MPIEFEIPIIVQPKQSTRFGIRNGKLIGYRTEDDKVKVNARALSLYMNKYVPKEPLKGPIVAHVIFSYEWRASESKATQASGIKYKDTKPDLDNLEKQLYDVMEKCGFYANDSQIAYKIIGKQWCQSTGVYVLLYEIDELINDPVMQLLNYYKNRITLLEKETK